MASEKNIEAIAVKSFIFDSKIVKKDDKIVFSNENDLAIAVSKKLVTSLDKAEPNKGKK